MLGFVSLTSCLLFKTNTPPEPKKILFIGNSITSNNHLSGIFDTLARLNNYSMDSELITYPGVGLTNHFFSKISVAPEGYSITKALQKGDTSFTMSAIINSNWDYIYLQGKGIYEEELSKVVSSIENLSSIKQCTFLIFQNYSTAVWSEEIREKKVKQLTDSLISLSALENVHIINVGELFNWCYINHPEVSVLSEDLHPTALGTFLIALLIYKTVFPTSPNEASLSFLYRKLNATEREVITDVLTLKL